MGKLRRVTRRAVKRLKVDNRRTRILTEAEQQALLGGLPEKLRAHRAAGAHHGRPRRASSWRCGGTTSPTTD